MRVELLRVRMQRMMDGSRHAGQGSKNLFLFLFWNLTVNVFYFYNKRNLQDWSNFLFLPCQNQFPGLPVEGDYECEGVFNFSFGGFRVHVTIQPHIYREDHQTSFYDKIHCYPANYCLIETTFHQNFPTKDRPKKIVKQFILNWIACMKAKSPLTFTSLLINSLAEQPTIWQKYVSNIFKIKLLETYYQM